MIFNQLLYPLVSPHTIYIKPIPSHWWCLDIFICYGYFLGLYNKDPYHCSKQYLSLFYWQRIKIKTITMGQKWIHKSNNNINIGKIVSINNCFIKYLFGGKWHDVGWKIPQSQKYICNVSILMHKNLYSNSFCVYLQNVYFIMCCCLH